MKIGHNYTLPKQSNYIMASQNSFNAITLANNNTSHNNIDFLLMLKTLYDNNLIGLYQDLYTDLNSSKPSLLKTIVQSFFSLPTIVAGGIGWMLGKSSGRLMSTAFIGGGLLIGLCLSLIEHIIQHSLDNYLDHNVKNPILHTLGNLFNDGIVALILATTTMLKEVLLFWKGSHGQNPKAKQENTKEVLHEVNHGMIDFIFKPIAKQLSKWLKHPIEINHIKLTEGETALHIPDHVIKNTAAFQENVENANLAKWKKNLLSSIGGGVGFYFGQARDYKHWKADEHLTPIVLAKEIPSKLAINTGLLFGLQMVLQIFKGLADNIYPTNLEQDLLRLLNVDPDKLYTILKQINPDDLNNMDNITLSQLQQLANKNSK